VDEGTNPDTFTVQLFRDSMALNQARWASREHLTAQGFVNV
jgi:hypothetical protein